MRKIILLLLFICGKSFAQITVNELNNVNIKLISDDFLMPEDQRSFPNLSVFSANKRKNWMGKKPRKGNGFGKYKYKNLVYECVWKNYKLNGKVRVTYNNLIVFEGIAKNNGQLLDGLLYVYANYRIRKLDAITKGTNGTYQIPVFKGELIANQFNYYYGTGTEFVLEEKYSNMLYTPRLKKAVYSKRKDTYNQALNGITQVYINKSSRKKPSDWKLIFDYTIVNGQVDGEFIDYQQLPNYINSNDDYNVLAFLKKEAKYFVKSYYQNGKLLNDKFQVFDAKTLKPINFEKNRLIQNKNNSLSFTYYDDADWLKYLTQLDKNHKNALQHQRYLKKRAEEDRIKREQERKQKELEIANRWNSVNTNCSPVNVPGKATYREEESAPLNVKITSDHYATQTFNDFAIWYRIYKVYDEVSNATYVVAWSANYLSDNDKGLGVHLVGITLANAIFPTYEYNQSTNKINIQWTLNVPDFKTGKSNYYKYTDDVGNYIYFTFERCDSSVTLKLVASKSSSIENNKDYQRFLYSNY